MSGHVEISNVDGHIFIGFKLCFEYIKILHAYTGFSIFVGIYMYVAYNPDILIICAPFFLDTCP